MKSNAAIWAGPGAPPPLTHGDIATIAAPRAGFDPSLQPGWKEGGLLESNNTVKTAAAEAALKKKAPKDK